jgi:hypothetical protein
MCRRDHANRQALPIAGSPYRTQFLCLNGIAFGVQLLQLVWLFLLLFVYIPLAEENGQPDTLLFEIGSDLAVVLHDGQTTYVKHVWATIDPDYVVLLLIAFTATTAVFHAVYMSHPNRFLGGGGENALRWVEYSITATIMIFVICLSSGVYRVLELTISCICVVLTMVLGYLAESTFAREQRMYLSPLQPCDHTCLDSFDFWVFHLMGWCVCVIPYVFIVRSFNSAVAASNGEIPPIVGFIVGIMLLLYSVFGVIQFAVSIVHSHPLTRCKSACTPRCMPCGDRTVRYSTVHQPQKQQHTYRCCRRDRMQPPAQEQSLVADGACPQHAAAVARAHPMYNLSFCQEAAYTTASITAKVLLVLLLSIGILQRA